MPAKKKVAALVKVALNAASATPAPPVGTALGPHGVNIMEFVKAYNAATESMRGTVIPVEITIYEDRSFTFITKTPPAAELIKKAAGVAKGSGVPQRDKVGRITRDQVREIATTKLPDLNANDVDAAMKIVEGTARSMGVTVSRVAFSDHTTLATRGRAGAAHTTSGERNQQMKRSKSYAAVASKVEADKLYAPVEALDFAKANTTAKFDETVDVSMRLGVDPRKADQMVRGTVNLPNGTGKTARVLVFATGDRAEAARNAGADEVGADELIDKVAGGYLDFDAVVATPDLMGKVGRLGRDPRSARPDAQPQDRHGDRRRRQGGVRHQGRQDRVPGGPARQPALHHRQDVLLHRAAGGELLRRDGGDPAAEAERRQGPVPAQDHRVHHHGPGHPAGPNRTRPDAE